MNPNEPVRLELFRHDGEGLAQQMGNCLQPQPHVVAFRLHCDHIAGIDEQNPSLYLEGNPRLPGACEPLQGEKSFNQARGLFRCVLSNNCDSHRPPTWALSERAGKIMDAEALDSD